MAKKKELRNWLNAIADTEGEITVTYEGGSDSGGATFQVDGGSLRSDYPNQDFIEIVTETALDHLGYGSFAGDFWCSGTLTYNPKTGKFSGTDNYSEDEGDDIELRDDDEDYPHKRIPIRIPKHLWFDELFLGTEGYVESGLGVSCSIIINNGPVTQEHADLEDTLTEYFEEQVRIVFNRLKEVTVNYAYNEITLTKADFTEEDDFMVAYVSDLNYTFLHETEKTIEFTINQ